MVIFATLAAQLFRLLAFLLPLKIIILIGSSRVPHYFPKAFQDMEPHNLVVGLGVATICFYLLYLFFERLVGYFTERSADRLLNNSDKLALFVNQDELARKACRNFADAIAAVIFVGFTLGLIGYIHPSVAVTMAAWAIMGFAVAAIGGVSSQRFRNWLEANAAKYVTTISSTGIFAITSVIVAEFAFGAKFNVLYAMVSIILSRQALPRLGRVFINAIALEKLKPLINTLFFRGHIWSGKTGEHHHNVWDLLAPGEPERWLPTVLPQSPAGSPSEVSRSRFHQTGLFDLIAFEAVTGDGASYFVKIFGRKWKVGAAHEAALLGAIQPGQLPALPLFNAAEVDGRDCLVLSGVPGKPLSGRKIQSGLSEAKRLCLACQIPRDLAMRFKRTHLMLAQRLLALPVDRLELVAYTAHERNLVARFTQQMEPLAALLGKMPLAIYNPEFGAANLFRDQDGRLISTAWSRWTLEPVGAGWGTNKKQTAELQEALVQAKTVRRELSRVSLEEARLAALLFKLDKFVARQSYRSAIGLLSAVLATKQLIDDAQAGEELEMVQAA